MGEHQRFFLKLDRKFVQKFDFFCTKNVERLFRKDKRLFFQCIGFIVNISQVPAVE